MAIKKIKVGTTEHELQTTIANVDNLQAELDSKATQTDLNSHTSNTTVHITSTERTNWNTAKDHADAAHAPINAEKNQNAFSNIDVGSTTIAADSATDTLTLAAGPNVTITPDATNDKITISSTNTTYSAGTGISLSGTTFSNSGVRSVNTGTTNGTISVNTGGTNSSVSVYGLGSAAYTASTAYDKSGAADSALSSAKTYTDQEVKGLKDDLLNGAGDAYDTLKELGDLIDENTTAIDALETVAAGKANKSHTHTVSNITDLTATSTELNYLDGVTSNVQEQLDSKAAYSHTHSAATTSAAGFMSASDKSKLDEITASADSVAFSRILTSGTKVGTITINGTGTDLYAPTNTDTHYASGTVVGSSTSATSNSTSALTNGNVYLNHVENGTVKNSHKISGSGATTVTSDTSGNIVVSSTNTTYGVATSSSPGLVKSGTDITVDSSGNVSVNDDSHNHVISNIDNLQSSLDAKQATVTGGASTITSSNLTASRALISNSSGKVAVSDVTSTELGYLDGVTSNVQTQLNAKYQIYTQSIIVEGDADTYYPVAIPLSSDKSKVNHISIWKNLGSTTPSSYSGNHSNGTSSLWLLYEGRSMTWDGNGGFIKTMYKSQPYATLVAHTSNVGNASSYLFVWLRGGTCQYNISTDYSTTSTIYYESTNLGNSTYPINIAPNTAINNGGIYTSSPYFGYGNIQGNATTATTATTAAKATADADGNTISSTYRKLSNKTFSDGIEFNDYMYIDTVSDQLKIGFNYGRPDNEDLNSACIAFEGGIVSLGASNNIYLNSSSSISINADDINIGELGLGLTGMYYKNVRVGDQLKALGSLTTSEIGYLDGVTSNIQTQLNGKLSTSGGTINGSLSISDANNYIRIDDMNAGDDASDTKFYLDKIQHSAPWGTGYDFSINPKGGTVYLSNGKLISADNGTLSATTVTATTVNGTLNGNAASATIATTAKVSESDKGITTGGSGSAYTATVSGITALSTGVTFIMIPNVVSTTTAPTLNVNSLGAKTIRRRLSTKTGTTVAGSTSDWLTASKPVRVTYDGTYWVIDSDRPSATDIYGTIPITSGGTGATTAASARSNLGAMADVAVTSSDVGKFLRVNSSGVWAAETVPSAESTSF